MSHQSLYREYRPKNFSQVAGQEQVVGALQEQLKSGTVAHAYLFAGSRGLGKTSIARIFAKELKISEKDLYEIDAASNNSVDDIRALSENIYTLPFESTHKLYILDEAHMLSKGAWNAFLKTLEEPPAHAIFILATTELEKVPETVRSRCQVFEFRKPTREALVKFVKNVAKKEKYELETSAAELLAILADGSYRDALSILQKVLVKEHDGMLSQTAVGGNIFIGKDLVEKITGAPKSSLVRGFVTALHEGSAEKALTVLRQSNEQDVDMSLYLSLVLEEARTILLVRHAPELRASYKTELGEEYAAIEALAVAKDSKLTHATLKALLDASARIRFSPIPALPLELAVLELYGG
jgi:DNA polymerase-3 subunit gamma/tau